MPLHPHFPFPKHHRKSPSLAGRLALLSALALAASAPAAEVGASVHVDVHANVDIHNSVKIREAVPVPVVPAPVVAVPVVVAPPPPVVVPVAAPVVRYRLELSCPGSVRYQVRTSAWATHARGEASLELPARICIGDAPCHMTIPGLGVIDAAAGSEFLLTPNAEIYDLRIIRGGVRYSVTSRATLRVSSEFGLGACVSGVRATAARPCRGRACIDGGDALRIYNMEGALAFEHDGRGVREVAAGHGLRVSLAAATQGTASRALVYREVNSWADDAEAGYEASRSKSSRTDEVTRMKSVRKVEKSSVYRESYEEDDQEDSYREDTLFDTHSRGNGKGHEAHGNGKGLGHYKEKERGKPQVVSRGNGGGNGKGKGGGNGKGGGKHGKGR